MAEYTAATQKTFRHHQRIMRGNPENRKKQRFFGLTVIHLRFGHYEQAIVGHADFVSSIAVEDIFYGQPEKWAIFGVGICGNS